jgi:uncharacterized protein with HEPN domain
VALQDGGEAFETHAGIDGGFGEGSEFGVGGAVKLHEELEGDCHPDLQWFDLEEELEAVFGRRVDLSRKSLLTPDVHREADLHGFQNEKVVRYGILHSLTIIGEAANRLSEELRVKRGEIPWRRIIAFRHRLVHNYGERDLELVWEVARTLVPELRSQVASIRSTFPRELE